MKKQITKILLLAFLCLSMAFTAKAQSTIFYEDFESTSVGQIPTGWTQEIYSGTLLWEVVDEGYPNFNSVCFNTSGTYTNSDTELITPVIDFTGYRNAT
ncbi:MAG: hypothetical protein PHR20_06820, partial [Bacteroidales bacterium]|nr:hypothetical protein [Bacteroidales bacterium]